MEKCLVCQQNKVEIVKTPCLLQPSDMSQSTLGGSLNGFYHKSTQVRREECYYGGC
jgi:hypothetical protein